MTDNSQAAHKAALIKNALSATETETKPVVGSYMTASVIHTLGGSYGRFDLDKLLSDASEDQLDKALAQLKAHLDRLPAVLHPTRRVRHKKRGTTYEVIGTARLQAASPLPDDATLVLYRGDDDQIWARYVAEFEDGRFENV